MRKKIQFIFGLVCTLSMVTTRLSAQSSPSPGGVGTNALKLWLKADKGITGADGATITTWSTSSSGTYKITRRGGTQKYYTSSPQFLVNFNPSVYFNASGDMYSLTRVFDNNLPFQIYSVAQDMKSGGSGGRGSAGYGSNGNYPSFDLNGANYRPYFAFSGGTFSSKARIYNGSYAGSGQQPQIYAMSSPIGGSIISFVDNFQENTTSTDNKNSQIGNGIYVGSSQDYLWTGTVNEEIAFNRVLTAQENAKVQTYLAIKYGITLKNGSTYNTADYISAAGAKVWDATANAAYQNNVAGIARDDSSALNQKQSRSVNTNTKSSDVMYNGNMVTMGLGTIAASNNANGASFSTDKMFMLWGDNGANGIQSTDVPPVAQVFPSSQAPSVRRLSRVWKVQFTGGAESQNVQLQFNLQTAGIPGSTINDFKLLLSTNGSFSSADTLRPTTYDAINKVLTFNNVTQKLNLSQLYFTLASQGSYAPGGVANGLVAWYRADDPTIVTADGGSLTAWANFVGGGYNLTNNGTAPLFYKSTVANLVNFNPSVKFAGSGEMSNLTRLIPQTSGYHLLASSTYDGNPGDQLSVMSFTDPSGNTHDAPGLTRQQDGYSPSGWNPYSDQGGGEWQSGGSATASRAIMYKRCINTNTGDIPQIYSLSSYNNQPSSPYAPIYSHIDNYLETSTMTARQESYIGSSLRVGSSGDGQWKGRITEAIVYSKKLTSDSLLRVNTYLALKSGISLRDSTTPTMTAAYLPNGGSNFNSTTGGIYTTANQGISFTPSKYMASDGTIIFNPANNGSYIYNIAGIGRDDISAFEQRQSCSQDSMLAKIITTTAAGGLSTEVLDRFWKGNMLIVGRGAIAATNAANTNSFNNNLSYLIWADDGRDPREVTNSSDMPTQIIACGNNARLGREWKAQLTGDAQTNLTLSFNLTNLGTITGTVANQMKVMVDEDGDGDFTTGNVRLYTVSSYANGVATANGVTIKNGEVFTLATKVPEDGVAYLIPSGSKNVTQILKCNGANKFNYFYKSDDLTKKIFAVNPNNNNFGLTNIYPATPTAANPKVTVDANAGNYTLSQQSSMAFSALMPRFVQVDPGTAGMPRYTTNGGLKVRIYVSQSEIDATDSTVDAAAAINNIVGTINTTWFKYEGNVNTVISNLRDTGLIAMNGTQQLFRALTPDSIGIEDSVQFVEFWNIDTLSTFGYIASIQRNYLNIAGNIWNDGNGNIKKDAGTKEPFLNPGGGNLYAILVNTDNTVLEYAPIQPNGSYSFDQLLAKSTSGYNVIISTDSTSVSPLAPAGWAFTGQDTTLFTKAGLNTPLGAIPFGTQTADLMNYNFGVDQLPVSQNETKVNVPNSVFADNTVSGYLGAPINNAALGTISGTDAEDCLNGCPSVQKFYISTINSNTQLYYNSKVVNAGDTLFAFDPSKLVIYGAVGAGTDPANPIGFTYSLVDSASKISAPVATYRITTVVPLPVTITSFTVQPVNLNGALLTWSVKDASNFSHFEIERSTNGTVFTKVGNVSFVDGTSNYSFTDNNLNNGTYQYRLKEVDIDGNFKYSPVRFIIINQAVTIQLTPNPATNKVYVKGITAPVEVLLFDIRGRLLQKTMVADQYTAIDISSLASDVYVVKVIQNDKILTTTKVIKQ